MNDSAIYETVRSQVVDFLHDDETTFELLSTAKEGQLSHRVVFDIEHFDGVLQRFGTRLLEDPLTYMPPCEDALRHVAEAMQHSGKFSSNLKTFLGIKGWLGMHHVSPRGLTSNLLNCLVSVEGIVSQCGLVNPKLVKSVYLSEGGAQFSRMHGDSQSLHRDKYHVSNPQVPKEDREGRPMIIEVGLCEYRDSQRLTIQEMPESAPTGQLPRSVDVIMQDDLVDSVKPGDRVRIFGVYRTAPSSSDMGRSSGFCKTFLLCNNVEKINAVELMPNLGPSDIKTTKAIAAHPRTLEILAKSVAATMCGHEVIKQGLLLQLLGGCAKTLESGMRLRGDIHALLIGEPSCGKSQMLRFMMNVAPLSISTTGRGASGVGLTAAVTNDGESGERRLEAGAMVLGDGGLVCIDEFDKMSEEDRVAIHEVMEQQTITICKAGVHTTLNARCSILSAANPIYGNFDVEGDLKNQISFPDSLLSRFDLIYIVRDSQTQAEDRKISRKVLSQLKDAQAMPRQSNNQRQELTILQPTIAAIKEIDYSGNVTEDQWAKKVFPPEFLRKYLYIAKNHCEFPALTEEACEATAEYFSELRQSFSKGGRSGVRSHAIPTVRSLEACIRLATAHAKLKLRSEILAEDVAVAEKLLNYTLLGQPYELEEDDEAEIQKENNDPQKIKGRKRTRGATAKDVTERLAALTVGDKRAKKGAETGNKDVMDKVGEILNHPSVRVDGTTTEALLEMVNMKLVKQKDTAVSNEEFTSALDQLVETNRLMIEDGSVYFI
eukprot:GHVP01026852.1.p1 GENE.GHVP01026852.1~~GHVP01026852.1.p1  ORF type:complete len:773 (+),score=146.71 GHVP01026852.1:23-2341(+)